MATDKSDEDVRKEFRAAVNMTAKELEGWLETAHSRESGQSNSKGDESIGHASGRRIVDILHRKQGDLSEADVAHMRKVVGYINRHRAQRPAGDVQETTWRYSLMNWGHDPTK